MIGGDTAAADDGDGFSDGDSGGLLYQIPSSTMCMGRQMARVRRSGMAVG